MEDDSLAFASAWLGGAVPITTAAGTVAATTEDDDAMAEAAAAADGLGLGATAIAGSGRIFSRQKSTNRRR